MRKTILAALGGLVAASAASLAFAQSSPDPADAPFYYPTAKCTHRDGDACDAIDAPRPDYNPLVGTWQRISLLRLGFSMQPPEASLSVKYMEDGYFSELELPANRAKVDKPLAQQTAPELLSRFDRVAGTWGKYTQIGQKNWRRHEVRLVPSPGGIQERQWRFEGNLLILEGTGYAHSPVATFMKLPRQPLTSTALTGSWKQTALVVNGAPVPVTTPEILLLGTDGWFTRTLFPPGRKALPTENALRLGNVLNSYTVANFMDAYNGVSGARGTYNATAKMLIIRDIGDVDPNLEGKLTRGNYTLNGDTFTWDATDSKGQKFKATYARLEPFDIQTPVPGAGP